MSQQIFAARLVVQSSASTIHADEFDVTADITDATGLYSAGDVQVGDVLFLDTRTSQTVPNVVSRFLVVSIASSTFFSVTCRIKYMDAGSPVDPIDATGQFSFISRPSPQKGFTWLPGPETQGIPVDLIELAQNSEFWDRVDPITSGGGSSKALENVYLNSSGATLPALKPTRNASGNLGTIDPSNEGHVKNILGIVKADILNSASGAVVLNGLIENVTTSLTVGDVVYLSKTGGITASVPDIGVASFVIDDFVVRLGQITKNSTNPSNKDFLVKIEIVGRL